jgi:hypothetical protein
MLKNTVVLSRSESVLVTATGGKRKSANIKTGNMLQIMASELARSPVDSVRDGRTADVCFGCPIASMCYVNTGQMPNEVWKAAQPLPVSTPIEFSEWAKDKPARIGAWGDPAAMALPVLEMIADGRQVTSYTHQWADPTVGYLASLAMASVESPEGRELARQQGYRTFRVMPEGGKVETGELLCPNYTHGIKCADCLLCGGDRRPTAKDIAIPVHGTHKKKAPNYVR